MIDMFCMVSPMGSFWNIPGDQYMGTSHTASITLSNGEKTVVFQSMMHIASPSFYDAVRADMQLLVGQEYVFFYEGVRPGTVESIERLGTLLGTDVSPEMYDTLAHLAHLESQKTEDFISILPSTNVDISTDDIVRIAQEQNI